MLHDYHITMDSFGADCPQNWREIADYLNGVIDETLARMGADAYCGDDSEAGLSADARDALDAVWERYCDGALAGAPAAVMED